MMRCLFMLAAGTVVLAALGGLFPSVAFAAGPPTINGFVVNDGSVQGTHNISGTVTNVNPGTTTVTIGGVLGSKTIPVNPDGTFATSIYNAGTVTGAVTGQATDSSSGQSSDKVYDYIPF